MLWLLIVVAFWIQEGHGSTDKSSSLQLTAMDESLHLTPRMESLRLTPMGGSSRLTLIEEESSHLTPMRGSTSLASLMESSVALPPMVDYYQSRFSCQYYWIALKKFYVTMASFTKSRDEYIRFLH